MPKPETDTDKNTQPKLTVKLCPGQVSAAQRLVWKGFWQKLIDETKSEAAK